MNDAIWMSSRCTRNRESFPGVQWARRNIDSSTLAEPDGILTEEPTIKHARMTENVTVADTSVRTLQDCWQLCLSHPSSRKIIIHAGYFDKLWKTSDSELLRKKEKKKEPGCSLINWVIEGRCRFFSPLIRAWHLHVSAMEKNVTDSLLRHLTGVSGAL